MEPAEQNTTLLSKPAEGQFSTVAGGPVGMGSLWQPALPQLPVSLSPKVSTVTLRSAPPTQSGVLITVTDQQNCQFTAPAQLSPKLLPGSPGAPVLKNQPGPWGPMLVPAVPVTLAYQSQLPVPWQGGGADTGVNVEASHPGPSAMDSPWNQLVFCWDQLVTVKQKFTVCPQA